jgi:cell division protein FtsL
MNAAARLVHQNVLSRHLIFIQWLTWRQPAALLLTFSILLSAFSIIYVTHSNRALYATYQHFLVEQDQLTVRRSQLLLERSMWLLQSRVQHVAERDLAMAFPDHQSVVVVHE